MIELFGFCFSPMILIIHRIIITDFTPLHYFRVFFQPEKSTFFRGSTGIFTCLLTDDRSQSLTKLPFSRGFFISYYVFKQMEEKIQGLSLLLQIDDQVSFI